MRCEVTVLSGVAGNVILLLAVELANLMLMGIRSAFLAAV